MNPTLGGPSQGIRLSIPELSKLGVQNEVVCQDDPREAFLSSHEFKIHALGPSHGPWRFSFKLLKWLKENIYNYDVVIIHGLWLYHSYAVMKAVKHLKNINKQLIPKVFIMPHGMLDPWFQNSSSRRLKSIRNWLYWHVLEYNVVNNADGLLFTTDSELNSARSTFTNYRPKKEINVGYGVQEPLEYSDLMRSTFLNICPDVADKPYILFLSRIHPKKGLDLLINAYKYILNTDLKDKLPCLVIAGPGIDSKYGQYIKKMIVENDYLTHYIYFTNMISGDAKWGCLYGCEAFILPSHQENFGIAVAEALACSKPVLITNKINIFQNIENSFAGIVEDDTLDGTIKLLTKWISLSNIEKNIMSSNARLSFFTYFSIKSVIKRLYDLLND